MSETVWLDWQLEMLERYYQCSGIIIEDGIVFLPIGGPDWWEEIFDFDDTPRGWQTAFAQWMDAHVIPDDDSIPF